MDLSLKKNGDETNANENMDLRMKGGEPRHMGLFMKGGEHRRMELLMKKN